MPKAELTVMVEPKCKALADRLGFELVDVCLDKESAGKYLRIYIDKEEGISLDDCETYHRAIQPQLESYDYDFLEVSSPGIERVVKYPWHFTACVGCDIVVKLYAPMQELGGVKQVRGILVGYDEEEDMLTLRIGTETDGICHTIPRAKAASVRTVFDF